MAVRGMWMSVGSQLLPACAGRRSGRVRTNNRDPSHRGMEMSDNGNGNTRRSLLQGVFNEMVESGRHKRNARELLKQLDAWIADSIMRDDAFMDQLIRAIEDNAPHDQVDS